MLPFCGYNMGDYFKHWLEIGQATTADKLPKLFWVNWFRKDEDGAFMWPGFGDNSRVLKWVVQRLNGEGESVETAIGHVPTLDAIDRSGLDLDDALMAKILEVNNDAWRAEIPQLEGHYEGIGSQLPDELRDELRALEKRLAN